MKIFKLVIVGNSKVGKTSYVERVRTGRFEEKYIPTVGVEVHPITFNTNVGPITFNVWDVMGDAHDEKYDDYFKGADAGIVMYDATKDNDESPWGDEIFELLSDQQPLVHVYNKCDLVNNYEQGGRAIYKVSVETWDNKVSTETGENILTPFLVLARDLMNEPTLEFIE